MSKSYLRCFLALLAITMACGCSSYQPVKNVWKSTKGLWNTYVSPPATVDYEDKGDLPPVALALSNDMMGIDIELGKLERAMQNADKPPTQEWLNNLFAAFPWISGFAGIKYDGTILGQQPAASMKQLDFIPLLYEDKKQNSRALRADVQPDPLGPEIMLATPLYDGIDFLGIVVAYFDMRQLMGFSGHPEEIVILCPTALLWPGKYDFAATPLAGVDWGSVVKESTAGKCSNANGSFFYMVRYLGNLPLVFAIPETGNFPDGNGQLEQGLAFFPSEREKLPPPPMPERKPRSEGAVVEFGKSGEEAAASVVEQPVETASPLEPERQLQKSASSSSSEIQPGSRESVLLRGGKGGSRKAVRERQLEGENIEVERVQRSRRPARAKAPEPLLDLIPDVEQPTLPGGRPSPFGPKNQDEPAKAEAASPVEGQNAAENQSQDSGQEQPAEQTGAEQDKSSGATGESAAAKPDSGAEADGGSDVEDNAKSAKPAGPALLPGGRPSPFGPRN